MRRRALSFVLIALAALRLGGCRLGYDYELPPEEGVGGDASGGLGDPGMSGKQSAGGLSTAGSGGTLNDAGSPDPGSGGSDVIGDGGTVGDGGSPGEPLGGGGASTGGSAGSATGGSAGSSGGGTGGAAGTAGSAGSGGSGGSPLTDIVVSTATDEQDSGATVSSPGGSGLSLREAILLANSQPGHQKITFDKQYTIALSRGVLPTIQETLDIVGTVSIDGSPAGSSNACLRVDGSDVLLTSLVITGCVGEPVLIASGARDELSGSYLSGNGKPITVYGDAQVVLYNYIAGSAGQGVKVFATNTQVLANRIMDTTGAGVFVDSAANGAFLLANVIIRGTRAIELGNPSGITVWHNTFSAQSGIAFRAGGATQVDFRNNIVAGAGTFGIEGTQSQFLAIDHNLYFGNTSGNCSACTAGTGSVFANPLFVNPGADDLTLQATSPAIDKGVDLGQDRNLSGAGNFNGAAPDLGFVEAG